MAELNLELPDTLLERTLATFGQADVPEQLDRLEAWLTNTLVQRVIAVESQALQDEHNALVNAQLQTLRETLPDFVPVPGDRAPQ